MRWGDTHHRTSRDAAAQAGLSPEAGARQPDEERREAPQGWMVAAPQGEAEAPAALVALAQAVCPAEWRDRQRSGPDPAQWAAAKIDLSAAYGQQADGLTGAQAELHQLPRRLQEAPALITYQSQQLAEYAPAATEPPARGRQRIPRRWKRCPPIAWTPCCG